MVTSKFQSSTTDACWRYTQTANHPSEGCGERIEKFVATDRDSLRHTLRNNIRRVEGGLSYAGSPSSTGEDEISRLLAPQDPITHRDTKAGSKPRLASVTAVAVPAAKAAAVGNSEALGEDTDLKLTAAAFLSGNLANVSEAQSAFLAGYNAGNARAQHVQKE